MGVDRTPGSSRALRLDPFALPVRYTARDAGADGQLRDIELDRDRVMVRRAVHGIAMRVRVPVTQFCGVSLRILPPEDPEPATVVVTLEHRDQGLSVPLFLATDGTDAVAQWKSWGHVLGLPLLVENGDGTWREPLPRIGRIGVGLPKSLTKSLPKPRRRRRTTIKGRRASILMRRKPGRMADDPAVHRNEREIIARN